jgi:hypothetical protein
MKTQLHSSGSKSSEGISNVAAFVLALGIALSLGLIVLLTN